MASTPDQSLLSALASRWKAHWRLKCFGTIGITVGFFVGYFLLLRDPVFSVTVMPVTAIDRMIGLQPWALFLYISLWVYIQIAPSLIIDRRELVSLGWFVVGLSVFSFGIFFFWPTTLGSAKLQSAWASGTAIAQLKSVDASGNACPSLHVTFAVFFALWNWRLARELGAPKILQALNVVWCLGIVYSTLATKQHVFLDVVAGAVLGVAGAWAHMRFCDYPLREALPQALASATLTRASGRARE